MDSRLKAVLVVLVAALIGAMVAGGAISYVNGNRASPPLDSSTFEPDLPERDETSGRPSPTEEIVRASGGDAPAPSEGPPASFVEIGRGPKPPPKPKERTRTAPVVEEESADAKEDTNAGAKPDDGGSSRDEATNADGGSLR